jgi:hypothetical protein
MRTKQFSTSLVSGETTSIYWPVDTHLVPDFGIGFAQASGAGSISGASVAYTLAPVLAKGTTSAGWASLTSAAAAVTGFSLLQVDTPATCFRFACRVSGSAVLEWAATQYGSP